jgi:uncharacterized protein
MTQDDGRGSNPSRNPSLADLLSEGVSRRRILQGGLGAASGLVFLGCTSEITTPGIEGRGEDLGRVGRIGFQPIPVSTADRVIVPAGYTATVLYAWGDPISDGPAFNTDASNTAADQELQAGMHHDGMHFFPLARFNRARTRRGLLVMNHEYTDDGLLHVGGMEPWTADKVRKSQAAHGVSVIEIELVDGAWQVVRPSRYARRITGYTPIDISGPAAGHALLQTEADPTGQTALGTINNCAHGHTPWGTYLTCEENWNNYFINATTTIDSAASDADKTRLLAIQKRYGVAATSAYRWYEHDARFDAAKHPHESHRFGWVVEIDPFRPESTPVKRTALGRFKHEGATVTESVDGHAVVYSGDDERFEYVYKFVSELPWQTHRANGQNPLDHGTLYVAKFASDGSGSWLPLTFGAPGLTEAEGFASQADVLIETRRAAESVGATKMDRPEWISTPARGRGEVYMTLTNNNRRGVEANPGVDEANPRIDNVFGGIIRWHETGGDHAALDFEWELFVLCGDPNHADPNKHGNIVGDIFGSPDGLWFDDENRLWIQTDVSTSVLNTGDYASMGNNQMLVANPRSGEIKRFLTGPAGCEVTGIIGTPDRRTLFVNIQHPGEPSTERNDPATPQAVSSWPDGPSGGRPRSATIVIRKNDGGVIGS